jgi:hemoglobin
MGFCTGLALDAPIQTQRPLREPLMKKDITHREDIEKMVQRFYEKVAADPLLGPIFEGPPSINWEKHLSAMCDFWQNALFYTGTYTGNPVNLHQHLHRLMPLNQQHFQQWNRLFIETVDELYSGKNALLAKQRALNISQIIQGNLFG